MADLNPNNGALQCILYGIQVFVKHYAFDSHSSVWEIIRENARQTLGNRTATIKIDECVAAVLPICLRWIRSVLKAATTTTVVVANIINKRRTNGSGEKVNRMTLNPSTFELS